MKKYFLLVSLVGIAAPLMAFHSIESSSTYDCDSCHIPHKAQQMTDMPLWSGTMTTQTSWTNYSSETMDATPGDPEGPTLLCLACHDATDGSSHTINSAGGDLSGTHPIEFSYAMAAAQDPELHPEASPSNVVHGRGTIRDDLLSATKGYVNCQSCHDIHLQGLHGQLVQWDNDAVPQYDAGGNPILDGEGKPVTAPGSGEFELSIPHLVNIPGIQWGLTYSARRAGLNYLAQSYELNYGALCKTCHIK
ncbi:MAG: hypothetical protein IH624_01065 [Phycisphaerae bacterium]|nr:hypothetical protein [Phycisphaerae bacterium]